MLLLDHLETIWQRPDEGIWETRGGRQQFTYSKMMAWVAFDRASEIATVTSSVRCPHRKMAKAPRHHPHGHLQ
jgi:GH15 family glucan-1,4-alpha-glucosidase